MNFNRNRWRNGDPFPPRTPKPSLWMVLAPVAVWLMWIVCYVFVWVVIIFTLAHFIGKYW